MNSFKLLQLPSALERALHAMKYDLPTPIQAKAIPVAMNGDDLIATAQTGTGKTAAFSIPTACYLLENLEVTGLVLAPTRELAQQIEESWRDLTKFSPELRAVCVIGGTSFNSQAKGLSRNPRLIIATPGRLLDHLKQRTVNLSKIAVLILDEADRMLDMGFAPQLNQILKALPRERQTLLFSATWPADLDQLAKKYLQRPVRIAIGSTSQAAKTVEQAAIATTVKDKNETLLDELNARQQSTILIFARTQVRTDRLARFLTSFNIQAGRIHGGRSQGQRNAALAAFKSGKMRILVATDIAARGIDVADIGCVINYDLPMVAEDYIHRIGRTGRAGSQGQALSLLTPEDRAQWKKICQLLKKTGSTLPAMRDRAPARPAQAQMPREQAMRPAPAAHKHVAQLAMRPVGQVIRPVQAGTVAVIAQAI